MRIPVLLALCVAFNAGAYAGDPESGKAKSVVCGSCHGQEGISSNPLWPNIAGQQELYMVKQLKAFRDGTRSDPLMSPMAKALTDDDIEDLAAYYSSLE